METSESIADKLWAMVEDAGLVGHDAGSSMADDILEPDDTIAAHKTEINSEEYYGDAKFSESKDEKVDESLETEQIARLRQLAGISEDYDDEYYNSDEYNQGPLPGEDTRDYDEYRQDAEDADYMFGKFEQDALSRIEEAIKNGTLTQETFNMVVPQIAKAAYEEREYDVVDMASALDYVSYHARDMLESGIEQESMDLGRLTQLAGIGNVNEGLPRGYDAWRTTDPNDDGGAGDEESDRLYGMIQDELRYIIDDMKKDDMILDPDQMGYEEGDVIGYLEKYIAPYSNDDYGDINSEAATAAYNNLVKPALAQMGFTPYTDESINEYVDDYTGEEHDYVIGDETLSKIGNVDKIISILAQVDEDLVETAQDILVKKMPLQECNPRALSKIAKIAKKNGINALFDAINTYWSKKYNKELSEGDPFARHKKDLRDRDRTLIGPEDKIDHGHKFSFEGEDLDEANPLHHGDGYPDEDMIKARIRVGKDKENSTDIRKKKPVNIRKDAEQVDEALPAYFFAIAAYLSSGSERDDPCLSAPRSPYFARSRRFIIVFSRLLVQSARAFASSMPSDFCLAVIMASFSEPNGPKISSVSGSSTK
jgi:hypothetical protein